MEVHYLTAHPTGNSCATLITYLRLLYLGLFMELVVTCLLGLFEAKVRKHPALFLARSRYLKAHSFPKCTIKLLIVTGRIVLLIFKLPL